MVVIRLARYGAKKRPFYRIVVADKRCRRDGRNIESLGYFNPLVPKGETKGEEKRIKLNLVKAKEWISKGAQPSDRVKSLMKELESGTKEAS